MPRICGFETSGIVIWGSEVQDSLERYCGRENGAFAATERHGTSSQAKPAPILFRCVPICASEPVPDPDHIRTKLRNM